MVLCRNVLQRALPLQHSARSSASRALLPLCRSCSSLLQELSHLRRRSTFATTPILLVHPPARKMVTKYGKKELATGAIASCIACGLMLVLPITPDGKGLLTDIVCMLLVSGSALTPPSSGQ